MHTIILLLTSTGMLERAVCLFSWIMDIEYLTFIAGSSKQGYPFLASVGSKSDATIPLKDKLGLRRTVYELIWSLQDTRWRATAILIALHCSFPPWLWIGCGRHGTYAAAPYFAAVMTVSPPRLRTWYNDDVSSVAQQIRPCKGEWKRHDNSTLFPAVK